MRTLALISLSLASLAGADECALSLTLSPPVVYGDQSVKVDMFAHFPGAAHAFAHTDATVQAGIPAWSVASAGVIAGPTVQGISVGQAHNPFLGVMADPSNPIRIWTGVYAAQTGKPMLVPITATPLTFSYYPSPLTTSTASCDAEADRSYLFVNPVPLNGVPIAPGEGTRIGQAGEDLLVAGEADFPILFGLLVPTIQKVRIAPSGRPSALTLATQYRGGAPSGRLFLGTQVGVFQMQPDWPVADEYEYAITLQGQTIRLRIAAVNNRGMMIDRLPETYGAWVERDEEARADYAVWRTNFGQTVPVIDPLGRPTQADSIEVRAIRHNSPGGLTAESHTVEVRGPAHGGGGAGKCHVSDLN